MNKLCQLLNIQNEDDLFESITNTFKEKITQWDYFVNWKKVLANIAPIEKELHLLNFLIGKDDIETEVFNLIKEYPKIVKTFPVLIAIRELSVDVLIDTSDFIYKKYNFNCEITDEICIDLTEFFIHSGLADLIKSKHVTNFVDYVLGVEVGLDSNGRKNRGGSLMEAIVEKYVQETCEEMDIAYIPQATTSKIKDTWGIEIQVDKSSRQLDFAINKNGQLYFIECNFYGGGGSKLKSTATEYVKMHETWNAQNIFFIWITDGAGWKTALKPLREYFDKTDFLLNLEMLKNGVLKEIPQYNGL
ncbi:type II restriction endonuclease [Flavobacterium sp. MK4S-17]|uniref:type II restriction endonuclease n=1 Tax=Flavobacterium sp. MK4S-17 TaxID=2543737 RepID=UPI00135B7B1E|nr:type II restriction endonuclease [Flavobacterium sp. MK4S-17]